MDWIVAAVVVLVIGLIVMFILLLAAAGERSAKREQIQLMECLANRGVWVEEWGTCIWPRDEPVVR